MWDRQAFVGLAIVIVVLTGFNSGSQQRPVCGPDANNDDFFFNVHPKDISVHEGGRAFLECNVSNHCHIQFHWTLNNSPVVNSTRRHQNGSNLVITRVNRTLDRGVFHCIATLMTTGLGRASNAASLGILWINAENASVQLLSPTEEDIKLGKAKEIQLACAIEGANGSLEYQWYHNGKLITGSSQNPSKNKVLRIAKPTAAYDNGVYSCRADNSAGEVNSTNNFVVSIQDAELPNIVIIPQQELLSHVGGRVVFDCVFDRPVEVRWRKVGEKTFLGDNPGDNRFSVLANNSLVIEGIQSSDERFFECTTRSTKGVLLAYTGRLRLANLDDFDESSFEPYMERGYITIPQGKTTKILCVPPNGYPKPKAFWTKNGVVLNEASRPRATSDLYLIIDHANKNDNGTFTCVAENLAGRKVGNVHISTSRAPKISYHPASKMVPENELTTVLKCSYEGDRYPVTKVTWEKDGKPIQMGRTQRLIVDESGGTLTINDARPSDKGKYVCVVRTAGQEPLRSMVADIVVRTKLKFAPAPVGKFVKLGSHNKFQCVAIGEGDIKIHWMKTGKLDINGTLVETPGSNTAVQFAPHMRDHEGTLFISDAKLEDSGQYTCVAVSPGQGVIRHNIKIEVAEFPHFIRSPDDLTVKEGETFSMPCQARGIPTPFVQWDREGITQSKWTNESELNRYLVSPNHTLTIRNVTVGDGGKFACTIGNRASLERKEALLCVKPKDAIYCYCGPEKGIVGTCPGVAKLPTLENGIPIHTIGIACGAAGAYIILVAILLAYCRYRRRRFAAKSALQETNGASKTSVNNHLLTAAATDNLTASTPLTMREVNTTVGTTPRSRPTSFSKRGFPRENLHYKKLLGTGVYGEVFLMRALGIKPPEIESTVVVKSLLSKDDNVRGDLEQEIEMYSKLDHPSIAALLGICMEKEPIYVITEYLEYGNLKHYLQASKHYRPNGASPGAYPPPLNFAQICHIAYQVVQGMEYLSNHRFVHRDLAARNVLLSPNFEVKITSLSLNNDAFVQDYYTYRHLILPLRWMAPEALLDDDWSMKSDVWSFGVFMWELFTGSELPFKNLSNEEVIEGLKSGDIQLSLPSSVPRPLEDLLRRCWRQSPKERPTFSDCSAVIAAISVDSGV